MAIDNIIFDLDGTLIDSSDGVVEAVNYSLEMMGEPLQAPEVIKKYIGFPLEYMYPDFSNANIDELKKHFQVKAAESVERSTTALPGVDAVLKQLQEKGYKMGIGTTKIKIHVDRILNKLGWNDYFIAATGGDEVENVKPAPDVFQLTLKRMNADAEASIVVGDTINDVKAAKAVPMWVITVPSPYGAIGENSVEPHFSIDSISDLPGLITTLNKAW